jgi:trans-L-3-hydroxyproline dehydratase
LEITDNVIMSNGDLSHAYWIETEDWHTAGEPFRIVVPQALPSDLLSEGTTVAEKRLVVLGTPSHPLDVLRRTLCHEPRGHGDMYGCFITPPDDAGANFGAMFWHKDGFSTACGHGTIALGYWAVANGIVNVSKKEGVVDVVIDVPSGRVKARVTMEDGRPVYADFVNCPSYVLTGRMPVTLPLVKGDIHVQFSYGGAVYGFVNANDVGVAIIPANVQEFVRLGRALKALIKDGVLAVPFSDEVYGIVFFREIDQTEATLQEHNITIFADGEVDRSPCGSATSARLAIHFTNGKIRVGHGKLLNRSVIGTTFEGDLVPGDHVTIGSYSTCITRVRGTANLVGKMNFFIDQADPLYPGFLLQ